MKKSSVSVKLIAMIVMALVISFAISAYFQIMTARSALNVLKQKSMEIFVSGAESDSVALEKGFSRSAESLNAAEAEIVKLVTGLFEANNNKLAKSFGLQILPDVENFDYDAAKDKMDLLTTSNPEILFAAFYTAKGRGTSDTFISGSKQSVDAKKNRIFTWLNPGKDTYLAVELQVDLTSFTAELNNIQSKVTEVKTAQNKLKLELQEEHEAITGQIQAVAEKTSKSEISKVIKIIILISFLGIIILAVTSWFLTNSLVISPLLKVVRTLQDIAQGGWDLTKRVDINSEDELGELAYWFNFFIDTLRQMITQTKSSSMTIDQATDSLLKESKTISHSTENAADKLQTLNRGAKAQKKEIEHMSSRVGELNSSAQEIAASAEATAASADSVNSAAEEGGLAIKDAVNIMQDIKSSSGSAVAKVSKLDEEAKKIGNIVSAITAIAEQTNLLALNAAIEAARAGEQGRGFAVVADEVRKLAESSAQSAGEISELIKGIQGSTEEVVKVIEVGNSNAEKGVDVVSQVGNSLENIIQQVRNITGKTSDISAAAQEQSASFAEVVTSMETVSAIATSTAHESSSAAEGISDTVGLVNKLAESSAEMNKLAKDLLEMMSRFKIGEDDVAVTGLKEF